MGTDASVMGAQSERDLRLQIALAIANGQVLLGAYNVLPQRY